MRMPGSAQLWPIGKPFATQTDASPPLGGAAGPKIVLVLPRSGPTYEHNEAFRNTFDRSPSKLASREIDALIGRFGDNAHNLGTSRDGRQQLRQSFRDAVADGYDSAVVVGHSIGNAGGRRELKLPDGSKVKLEEIHEWAATEGLQECRVITCYGRAFGIDAPVALGKVARLLSNLTYPVKINSSKPEEFATINTASSSKTNTNPANSNAWDDWDDQFSQRRDRLGYSDVILVGATRSEDGRLHVWESIRARPTWLALSSWLILIAGILANASVMWWMHRQELGSADSLEKIEYEAAERFRRSSKLALVTAVASGITLMLAIVAIVLVWHELQYNAATGQSAFFSMVNVPAPLGVSLMTLSALAGRVDPGRAWLARIIHALTGAVAGAVATILNTFKRVGVFGLAAFVWVNVLHAIACWYNGFDKLPALAVASLWWWLVICSGIAALAALYGTYQGLIAGYFDLPVFLAVRVGVNRLESSRPLRHVPKAITIFREAIFFLVGIAFSIALGWFVSCFALKIVAMIILFCLDPNRPVEAPSTWWGVAVGSVLTILVTLVFFVSFLLDRLRRWRKNQNPQLEGAAHVTKVPSPSKLAPTVTWGQIQPAAESIESGYAGSVRHSAQCFYVTPDGIVKLSLEETADEATPDPSVRLKFESGPWPRALGWVIIVLILLVPSAIYVNSIIDDPPYTVGTRVEFVGVETNGADGDIEQIIAFLYPPTVPVYQVQAAQTLPMDKIIRDYRMENGFGLDLGLGPFSSSLLTPEQVKDRLLKEQTARARREEMQQLLRGPSGVVFRREPRAEGIIDGVVVKRSRGEVIADDQGGRGDRGVLVRLIRDPGMGEDPGVVVVARAADLRVLSTRISPLSQDREAKQ
jgi:hypothetical protein